MQKRACNIYIYIMQKYACRKHDHVTGAPGHQQPTSPQSRTPHQGLRGTSCGASGAIWATRRLHSHLCAAPSAPPAWILFDGVRAASRSRTRARARPSARRAPRSRPTCAANNPRPTPVQWRPGARLGRAQAGGRAVNHSNQAEMAQRQHLPNWGASMMRSQALQVLF